eukprot:symbB.v1.2.024103.t1/scaffold2257.1/size84218/2
MMIDGNHCWEGPLQRQDLAGPLGDSWKDPANMRLLQQALVTPNVSAFVPHLGPRAEASWKIEGEDLRLTVRFIYREGPVAAIQGARFPKTDLKDALQKICASVRGLQEELQKQKAHVQLERGTLQQRQDVLKRRLEVLPEEVERHESFLLDALQGVLNAQKRRCRHLWESSCEPPQGVGPADPAPAAAAASASATLSLEECLDREVPNLGISHHQSLDVAPPAPALNMESSASLFSLSYDVAPVRADTTFSIPLTLGMQASHLSATNSGAKS